MKKNKAFTFAELMICLLIISVVAAILYPTIAQFTPNSNKPLFKSAYRILTEVLYELTSENVNGKVPNCPKAVLTQVNCTAAGADVFDTIGAGGLCTGFCKKANLTGFPACAAGETLEACCSDFCNDSDNFITTSNGMRWKFFTIANGYRIIVDVNASNNDLGSNFASAGADRATYFDGETAWNNGVFYHPATSLSAYANTAIEGAEAEARKRAIDAVKIQDTFIIEIDTEGKITDMSLSGWLNLEDTIIPD